MKMLIFPLDLLSCHLFSVGVNGGIEPLREERIVFFKYCSGLYEKYLWFKYLNTWSWAGVPV